MPVTLPIHPISKCLLLFRFKCTWKVILIIVLAEAIVAMLQKTLAGSLILNLWMVRNNSKSEHQNTRIT